MFDTHAMQSSELLIRKFKDSKLIFKILEQRPGLRLRIGALTFMKHWLPSPVTQRQKNLKSNKTYMLAYNLWEVLSITNWLQGLVTWLADKQARGLDRVFLLLLHCLQATGIRAMLSQSED